MTFLKGIDFFYYYTVLKSCILANAFTVYLPFKQRQILKDNREILKMKVVSTYFSGEKEFS